MSMDRATVTAGMVAEYQGFAELLRSLDDAQWNQPSRCDGWTVGNVAGHVVGQLDDVVNFRLDGLGFPEATQRQAEAGEAQGSDAMTAQLDGIIPVAEQMALGFDDEGWESILPGTENTLGAGVLALWEDTWVHGDDIRAALGQDPVRTDGILAVLHRAADELPGQGFGPATFVVDGERIDIGDGGDEITGDGYDLALVVTGRADPAIVGLDETANMYR